MSDTAWHPMFLHGEKTRETASESKLRTVLTAIPPTGLVLLSVSSTQIGAALAKGLFGTLGPAGTASLRVGFAALVLFFVWRPTVKGYSRSAYISCLWFGIALAAMNLCFYVALARIPLGVAVTLEFVGPLGVAIFGSRRLIDVLWVFLAASGIVSLAPLTGATFNLFGIVLALMSGACWAAYILFSSRVGRSIPGVNGLALAMAVAALILVPIGMASDGHKLFEPKFLLLGISIAVLSSVIPYSLEIEALRQLPTRVFGLLMSTEPAIAALVGYIFLDERIDLRSLIAIVLITIATTGTIKGRQKPETKRSR